MSTNWSADDYDDLSGLPEYTPSPVASLARGVSRSNTASSAGNSSHNAHWKYPAPGAPVSAPLPLNVPRRSQTRPTPPAPAPTKERYVYTYHVLAGSIPMQFLISVEPHSGRALPGKCIFRLTMQANGVERCVSEPVELNITLDPRGLEFVVFVFPGKPSIPTGCLHCFRVWLRTSSADHRVFGEDDLWCGKDPDFASVADASFARMKESTENSQTYQSFVGRAHVTFTVRWQALEGGWYRYSLEYEAGGIGSILLKDCRLRMDCDPLTISFIIYSVPVQSNPPGATHRLRLWLRSLTPFPFPTTSAISSHAYSQSDPSPRTPGSPPALRKNQLLNSSSYSNLRTQSPSQNHSHSTQPQTHHTRSHAELSQPPSMQPPQAQPQALPFNDSYIYQRLYKTDSFKVGAGLDFKSALGHKAVLGFALAGAKTMRVIGDGMGDVSATESAPRDAAIGNNSGSGKSAGSMRGARDATHVPLERRKEA